MAVRGGNAVFAPCGAPTRTIAARRSYITIPLPKAPVGAAQAAKGGAGFDAAAEDKRGAGTCGRAYNMDDGAASAFPAASPIAPASLAITGDCTCQWCQYNTTSSRSGARSTSSPRARWPRAWISGMKP